MVATTPRILFITCMPLETPRSASLAFMGVLLQKYPDAFAWFSLRSPSSGSDNPFNIPYVHDQPLRGPSSIPRLKQALNLIPWAWHLGYKAATFGHFQNVQVVLADLAFEAVVAGRVAARVLGVPLLAMVHDDPVNRIRVKNYPGWLVGLYEREFAKTLRSAQCCAVISDYMGTVYRDHYGVKTITLYPGVEVEKCLPLKKLDAHTSPVVIGSVGSANSMTNWSILIEAVRLLNRRYGAGKFRILHLGAQPKNLPLSEDVKITGWVPEDEFSRQLQRMDLGFLNWDFAPELADTGRTSFPLKASSYIRAQVPMLALGFGDSTVVRFVQDHRCGVVCTQPSPEQLAAQLSDFIHDAHAITEAQKGLQQLKRVFSRQRFFEKFESFVHVL